jgi:hypothetical protein
LPHNEWVECLRRHQEGLRPDVDEHGIRAAHHRLLVDACEQDFYAELRPTGAESEVETISRRVPSPEGFDSILKLYGFGDWRNIRE